MFYDMNKRGRRIPHLLFLLSYITMPDSKPQKLKIAYLLGAGATHAEKQLYCKIKKADLLKKNGEPKSGLLAKHISERVIEKLLKRKQGADILRGYGISKDSLYNIANPQGKPDVDIELFISLLETNKTEDTDGHTRIFRQYFKDDICKNLVVGKSIIRPRLCPALIEWHLKNGSEEPVGFLSLNYDPIFEDSMKLMKREFDYGINVEEKDLRWPHKSGERPFLKLHGSFDWFMSSDMDKMTVAQNSTKGTMQWIPPRLNKEYLNYPYNIIHGKAYELLVQCDILRIIGCGLNQNDIGLISLLFKTQHKGSNPYKIEIIGSDDTRKELVKRLGMLLSFEESFYSKDDWTKHNKISTNNPFLDWLYFKIKNAQGLSIRSTQYLKNIEKWLNL